MGILVKYHTIHHPQNLPEMGGMNLYIIKIWVNLWQFSDLSMPQLEKVLISHQFTHTRMEGLHPSLTGESGHQVQSGIHPSSPSVQGPQRPPGQPWMAAKTCYPLVMQQFANLNMAIEIVDLPFKNTIFHSYVGYVSLPEGNLLLEIWAYTD